MMQIKTSRQDVFFEIGVLFSLPVTDNTEVRVLTQWLRTVAQVDTHFPNEDFISISFLDILYL